MSNEGAARDRAEPLITIPPLKGVTVAGILGLVALVVAWAGASGRTESSDQIAWLNLGIAGVLLVGAVGGRWVMRGRHAVALRMARLLLAADAAPVAVATIDATESGEVVSAVGMTRYHHPDCLLVRNKQFDVDSRAGHERMGRRPCEMCRP